MRENLKQVTIKDIQISAEDSREVRELKQIVNGSGLLPLQMSDINAQLQSVANFIAKQTEFFGKMLAYFIMCMLDTIQAKRDEIYAVAKKHKAEMLWVFGSCARKEETPESDVDLLVKFSSGASLFDQGGLSHSIGQILGRGVDVVDSTALSREPFFSYAVKKDLVAI